MAVGLEFFLVPNEVIDGGIVGISIILSHLTDVQNRLLYLRIKSSILFLLATSKLEKHLRYLRF